jgi:hypothetical protein
MCHPTTRTHTTHITTTMTHVHTCHRQPDTSQMTHPDAPSQTRRTRVTHHHHARCVTRHTHRNDARRITVAHRHPTNPSTHTRRCVNGGQRGQQGEGERIRSPSFNDYYNCICMQGEGERIRSPSFNNNYNFICMQGNPAVPAVPGHTRSTRSIIIETRQHTRTHTCGTGFNGYGYG